MKNEIELTQDELDFIQSKRDKAGEEAKKLMEERSSKELLEIAKCKREIDKRIKSSLNQIEATKKFLDGFKSNEFSLYLTDKKGKMEGKHHYDIQGNRLESPVAFFIETFTTQLATIKHISGIEIEVREHFTSNGRYSMRSSNQGYKMFISGLPGNSERAYSRPSTVENKILDYIKTRDHNKTQNKIKLDFIEELIKNNPFPNSTISEKTIYLGSWRGNNWDKYSRPILGVFITLENGIKIDAYPTIRTTGTELVIHSEVFPKPKFDGERGTERIALLNKISK